MVRAASTINGPIASRDSRSGNRVNKIRDALLTANPKQIKINSRGFDRRIGGPFKNQSHGPAKRH